MEALHPCDSRARANATVSSIVQPPSAQSVPDTRTVTGRSARKRRSDRIKHLDRETHPVLEGTAIGVALAGSRAERGIHEGDTHGPHGFAPHRCPAGRHARPPRRMRSSLVPAPLDPVPQGDLPPLERERRGCHRLPAARPIGWNLPTAFPRHLAGRLPPGVGKLNCNRHLGPAADALQDTSHGGLAFVRIEANVGIGDASLGHDRSRFDGHSAAPDSAR